jgi:hypothetical protein
MGKRNVNTSLIIGLVIVVLFSGYTLLAKTSNNDGASGITKREGYIKHYQVTPGAYKAPSTKKFFTVPEGKQFVLTKVFLYNQNVYLTVDDETFIHVAYFSRYDEGLTEDFADKCIEIKSGQTLKAVNISGGNLRVTVVGYFYDV